uniref:hypothetical protein n=1 Tax=Serratia proteamaculans TaxID=28151 RepID=UPI001F4C404A|nr:hypothetical protein [Serratia proteamaculans]
MVPRSIKLHIQCWGTSFSEGVLPTFINIAALYRVKLLADIHDLSVGELSMLLSVSPYNKVAIDTLSDDGLTQLIQFLYQTPPGSRRWTGRSAMFF